MVKAQKKEEPAKEKKVTYFRKDSTVCPVCDKPFQREELFQGRVNAADLSDELHRRYSPMAAFGEVHPLIYPVTVCPNCYFSALPADFDGLNPKLRQPLFDSIAARIDSVGNLFPKGLDFASPRRLQEGAASYFLMMQSYEVFPDKDSPVVKQAIAAIRASWLFGYLDRKLPGQNYDYVAKIFVNKARFLYTHAIELDTKGKQSLQAVKFLGPDTDNNFGYDGVLYLSGALELKYGQKTDLEQRKKRLDYVACAIAKMFGLGKKTKNKPGPLLERARDLYDRLKVELGGKVSEEEEA
jgi:uncharacterized protein